MEMPFRSTAASAKLNLPNSLSDGVSHLGGRKDFLQTAVNAFLSAIQKVSYCFFESTDNFPSCLANSKKPSLGLPLDDTATALSTGLPWSCSSSDISPKR